MGHWGKLSFSKGVAIPAGRGGRGGGGGGGRGGKRGGDGGRGGRGGKGARRNTHGGPRPAPWAGKLGSSLPSTNHHDMTSLGGGMPNWRALESALDDKDKPFLNPRERRLVHVPLEFDSVRHYCALIAHNMLAEFWHVYREGPRGPEFRGTVVGDNEVCVDGCNVDEGMMHHLISIRGSIHLVTKQGLAGTESLRLSVRPALRERGSISGKSYGYVGSYINELKALIELAEEKRVSNVLQSVLFPRRDLPGDFVSRPMKAGVPVNPSQRQTVDGLKYALEKIQGPPGTGKSTTIFHIITARIPFGARVLVTCSRNVAVESIAQKLEHCSPDGLVVFGNASRIGETARNYLLDTKCERQPAVENTAKFSRRMQNAGRELIDGLRKRRTPQWFRCRSVLWRRAWTAHVRRRFLYWPFLKDWALRVGAAGLLQVDKIANGCKADVLRSSHIMLCTIASTSRLLREWEENCQDPLTTHTVIVDECGCTTESSVALLMRMDPKNLIMVGDHKQLPPTSMVPPQELQGTGHDRSLLERCVAASGSVHRLVEQYRMHDKICQVVSRQFYNSMLQTPLSVRQDRQAKEKHPLIWVSVHSNETIPPKTKSYVNYDEITAVQQVATKLREKHPSASIAILTFYKGQLQEMMRSTPAALQAEVLTVDSCQGSEFDYVILSTVRSNRAGTIGFVKDKQRINVAISRSLYGLVVVGDDITMSNDEDWKAIRNACESSVAAEWRPAQPLPIDGTFESVMDQLKGLQMRKREEALAQQEIDAVKLMEHQPSFRAKSFSSGGSGYTVIGGGGAKSAAAQGKAHGRGFGARESRDSRDRFDKGGRTGRDAKPDRVPAQRFDLVDEEFPDLDEGTELILNQPKKVACRAHGMYGCAACGLGPSQSAAPMPARPQHAFADDDHVYGSEQRMHHASGGGGQGVGQVGRLRIDKSAAARFVAHGIGYNGPMPRATGMAERRNGHDREQGGQTSWGRAMELSKSKQLETSAFQKPKATSTLLDRSAPERFGALPPPVHDDGWQTCNECGVEGDALEPDCDNPGTYYCLDCWQRWERGDLEDSSQSGHSTPQFALDPNLREEGLFEIFGHLGVKRVKEVLDRFQDSDSKLERAFNVLLEIGDEKEKCYHEEFESDQEQEVIEPSALSKSDVLACGECSKQGLSDHHGRVDYSNGIFYCFECWALFEEGVDYAESTPGGAAQSTHGTTAAPVIEVSAKAPPPSGFMEAGQSAGHAMQSIAVRAPPLPAVRIVHESSELCSGCNTVGFGRVDDLDGNFYCDRCWSSYMADGEAAANCRSVSELDKDLVACDFWGEAEKPTSKMGPEILQGMGGLGMLARGESNGYMPEQGALHSWAKEKVTELLTLGQESFVDPDVVVRLHT